MEAKTVQEILLQAESGIKNANIQIQHIQNSGSWYDQARHAKLAIIEHQCALSALLSIIRGAVENAES